MTKVNRKILRAFSRTQLVITALVIGVVGLLIVVASLAATYTSSVEPEGKTINSPATRITSSTASGGAAIKFGASSTSAGYTFPLKVSSNSHYLVDQNNKPFLYVADTAWSLLNRLSISDAKQLIDTRKAQGFTAIQSYMMVWGSGDSGPRGQAFQGGNITQPIESFFAGNDEIINYAASQGIVLLIGPFETGSNQGVSTQDATTYGTYLANRYRNAKNVIWFAGGDYDPNFLDALKATGNALHNTNPANLVTNHFWGLVQPTNIKNEPWLSFYSYQWNGQRSPWTYEDALEGYSMSPTKPWLNIEPSYEPNTADGQTIGPRDVRMNGWWSILSGAMGVVYGGPRGAWNIGAESSPNWGDVNRPAAVQTGNIQKILSKFSWEKLAPDSNNIAVTSGRGSFGGSDYVAAGRASDGSLIIAYTPSSRTLGINLSQLSGAGTAQWHDPVSGAAAGTATSVTNSGTQSFSTPGNNSGGDSDWVLVIKKN